MNPFENHWRSILLQEKFWTSILLELVKFSDGVPCGFLYVLESTMVIVSLVRKSSHTNKSQNIFCILPLFKLSEYKLIHHKPSSFQIPYPHLFHNHLQNPYSPISVPCCQFSVSAKSRRARDVRGAEWNVTCLYLLRNALVPQFLVSFNAVVL